jgi:hypothetical protein
MEERITYAEAYRCKLKKIFSIPIENRSASFQQPNCETGA